MSDPQVFVPTTEERVAHLAEIQSMRAMTELLRNINVTMAKMQEVVTDTRERLIKLESSGIGRSIDGLRNEVDILEKRVDSLEQNEHRRTGMFVLAESFRQWAPWLLAFGAGMWAFLERT